MLPINETSDHAADFALPELDSFSQLELNGYINNATQLTVTDRHGYPLKLSSEGIRTSSLIDEYESGIVHGRDEYYRDLCRKPFYAQNHTNYVGYDGIIGPICVTLADPVEDISIGIVRTCLGFRKLQVSTDDRLTEFASNVYSQLEKRTETVAILGLLMAKYLSSIPNLTKRALIDKFVATNQLDDDENLLDDSYGAILADGLEVCRDESLQASLLEIECIKFRRSFLYDVVLSSSGAMSSQRVFQTFLKLLGDPFNKFSSSGIVRSSSINSVRSSVSVCSSSSSGGGSLRKPSLGGRDHYASELVTTERSYVRKIRRLVEGYARPLRSLAASKSRAVINKFEAANIFGNIEDILKVNEEFLSALDKIGEEDVTLGSICLEHFPKFDVYRPYLQGQSELLSVNEEKRNKAYRDFLEQRKYDPGVKDRLGIRELLVEPIQRLPRYDMLLTTILDYLPEYDLERQQISDAISIVKNIALVKENENEKLAQAYFNMAYSIDRFPAQLISQNRRLLHCLDVDEIDPLDRTAMPSYLTLLLFDDKLVLLKRTNSSVEGPRAAGIDDSKKMPLSTFNATRSAPASPQKKQLIFKTAADIGDCSISDISLDSFQLHIDIPADSHLRPIHIFQTKKQGEKLKFLDHFNQAQALARTRNGHSTAYRFRYGRIDMFFNVFTRKEYAKEKHKSPIALVFAETDDLDGFDELFDNERPQIVGLMESEEKRLCLSLRSRPDFEDVASTVGTLVIPESKLLFTVLNELMACELVLEQVAPLALVRMEENRYLLEQALRPHVRKMPRYIPIAQPSFDLYISNSSTNSPMVERIGNLFRKPSVFGQQKSGSISPVKVRQKSVSSIGKASNDSLGSKNSADRW